MSEKSLEEILSQLNSERTACENILAEMQALKDGEFKEVFGEVFTTAALETYKQTELEISALLKQTTLTTVSASAAVSSNLQESISLLEEQVTRFKRIQRRCTSLNVISWALLLACFIFIGWTGSLYWLIRYDTSSFWFQQIIVNNAEVIDKCLDLEVIKQSKGKCTIQLPIRLNHE